ALRIARKPVVRDLLPPRRIRDELANARAHAGIPVDRPESHADLGVLGRVAGEQRRPAVGAEPLLVTVVGAPCAHPVLALDDPKRSGHDGRAGRGRGPGPALAAGAVAVA